MVEWKSTHSYGSAWLTRDAHLCSAWAKFPPARQPIDRMFWWLVAFHVGPPRRVKRSGTGKCPLWTVERPSWLDDHWVDDNCASTTACSPVLTSPLAPTSKVWHFKFETQQMKPQAG